jgi:GNAT superfamily N-acetyltransferase
MENCEPGQVRKEAALSGTLQAPPGSPTGVTYTVRFSARGRAIVVHEMMSEPSNFLIRPAAAGEAAALSALALRSKAHWGYDDHFLDTVRPLLTFTEADLAGSPVYVLTVGGEALGVYRISGDPPEGELDDLWLDPSLIGLGYGRRLFAHALVTARELGFTSLLIEGDPNAEGFYVAMGASAIGTRRSPSGRTLPLLRATV